MLRKAARDQRFRSAATVWKKLTPEWIQILSDDVAPELGRVVDRIARQPMVERMRHSKDLGETMVIAHAVVAAERGAEVIVLIDDELGAKNATGEMRRLERLRPSGGFSGVGGSVDLDVAAGRADS